jgi:hypothetical protein
VVIPEDVLTAYHEAAHAVVMVHFGIRFEDVTIDATDLYLGAVRGVEEEDADPTVRLIVSLAGDIGEVLHLASLNDHQDFARGKLLPFLRSWGSQKRMDTFQAYLETHLETREDDLVTDLEADLAEDRVVYPERDLHTAWRFLCELESDETKREAVGRELFDDTLRLVQNHWQCVEQVVTLLYTNEDETVSYAEVCKIYKQMQGDLTLV